MLASWAAAWARIVGKSMLIERAALAAFGGFAYFKGFLAEDFLLGETFAKSGFHVSTNFTWVTCRKPEDISEAIRQPFVAYGLSSVFG